MIGVLRKPEGNISVQGYKMIYGGYKKRIAEHRKVMEKQMGRKLRSDEIVHHIDHDKTNNDISNLTIMTRAEHARLHAEERKQMVGADG